MLIWSRKGRAAARAGGDAFAGVFLLPLAVILLSSLSKQWNGLLPTGFTLPTLLTPFAARRGFAVFEPDGGFCASLLALLCGCGRRWRCASMARRYRNLGRRFICPAPSPVSVGLGILVAFSRGRCR